MKWKKRPCNYCRRAEECAGVECRRWQVWFLEAWEGFNRMAAQQVRRGNRVNGDKFCYGLPHEAVDPCKKCPIRRWCDVPCQRRLWWWDYRMERIRKGISECEGMK